MKYGKHTTEDKAFLFGIDPHEARQHLRMLAEALIEALALEDNFFKTQTLSDLDEIKRGVDSTQAGIKRLAIDVQAMKEEFSNGQKNQSGSVQSEPSNQPQLTKEANTSTGTTISWLQLGNRGT